MKLLCATLILGLAMTGPLNAKHTPPAPAAASGSAQ